MPLWPRCSASIKRSPRSRDTQRQGRLQLLVGRLAFVPAAQARQMALANGSVWRRLVVDPLTGVALDLSTRRYRPTRAMADLIAARDGMCRGPGCTVPAERCDLDHDIPWPSGPTAITNLSRKHRRHHNHKTRGTWRATTADDGAITWRTRAKRRYVTHPRGDLDPLSKPVTEQDIERALAEDPPPFSRASVAWRISSARPTPKTASHGSARPEPSVARR